MTTSMTLDEAIDLARRKHQGARDKAGRPYIDHPLRVMERVRGLGERAMMVAVLHDLLEDTDCTSQELLAAGCPPDVVAAVETLSNREGESFEDFMLRVRDSGDPVVLAIKRADLEDNTHQARLADLPPEEIERLTSKYEAGMQTIE